MTRSPHLTQHLASAMAVPVCRPKLPASAALAPYLERIDEARWYSNHGYLTIELQERLADRLGGNRVALASSGTSAIAGAILAVAGRATRGKRLCLMPANTFIGTVSAVEQCGYEPYFVDVDRATWQLDPSRLEQHPKLDEVGLVVTVSPYGRKVAQKPWERFRDVNDIPVVIDGAAMIEAAIREPAVCVGSVPVAMSFHATKSFATGEGGAVVTNDGEIWRTSIRAMNFGFDSDRLSKMPSLNGKLSEYHAAVGLAELDSWEDKLDGYRQAAGHLRAIGGLSNSLFVAPDVASCYAIHVAATAEDGCALRRFLDDAGIGCRQWYGRGAHAHPHTRDYDKDNLSGTDWVVEVLTGLPMYPDLDVEDATILAEAFSKYAGGRLPVASKA